LKRLFKKNKFSFYNIYKWVLRTPYLAKLIFRLRLISLGIKRSNLLILATITKTGTHYIRFLLAYYIKLINLKKNGKNINKVSPDHFIIDKYFPNSWHSHYMFIKKHKYPTKLLDEISLVDIPRSHMALRVKEWSGMKVLHTYRNLLDQSVLSWETKYKCDAQLKNKYKTPWDLYLSTKIDLNEQKKSFENISTEGVNHFRIEFTKIFNDPINTLALIILWLGNEPDLKICKKAAELASKTPSILVGAGEKWHRDLSENINYSYLNKFISENIDKGGIDIYKKYFDKFQIKQVL